MECKGNILVLNGSPRPGGNTKQLKCAIDRLYAAAYPVKPKKLKKIAMILCSGDADMYEGAAFSYEGDFLGYLGLQDMGVITVAGGVTDQKLREAEALGKKLK